MAYLYTEGTVKTIKEKMTDCGLDQSALAKAVDMNPQLISNALRRAKHSLHITKLKRIADHLGVEPEFEEVHSQRSIKNLQTGHDLAIELTVEIVKNKKTPMFLRKKAADLLGFLVSEETA